MFSAQSLLAGNGASVTCLRESREPITTLNAATYVTPLVVRNFWLWKQYAYPFLIRVQTYKPHFNLFFTTISTPVKEFFFRARAEKGIARHIDASSVDSY